MPISLLFWIVMLLWLVLGFGWTWRSGTNGDYRIIVGGNLVLFLLLFLLGWAVFGFAITR